MYIKEWLIRLVNGFYIPFTFTFSVKDTGMGIMKENMPLLFKKFSRGEGSFLVHTEGTGLGLYVAKMIVEIRPRRRTRRGENFDNFTEKDIY